MFWALFSLPCLSEFSSVCSHSSPQQRFMVLDSPLCPTFPLHGVELTLPKPQTLMLCASLPTSQAGFHRSSGSGCIFPSRHPEYGGLCPRVSCKSVDMFCISATRLVAAHIPMDAGLLHPPFDHTYCIFQLQPQEPHPHHWR